MVIKPSLQTFTPGLMSSIINLAVSCFTCRYFRGGDSRKHDSAAATSQQSTTTLLLAAEVVQTDTQPLLTSTTVTSNVVFVPDALQDLPPDSS